MKRPMSAESAIHPGTDEAALSELLIPSKDSRRGELEMRRRLWRTGVADRIPTVPCGLVSRKVEDSS
jgi:hypothetical protein